MWKVRELADKVTNVVMNYTEIESKVREATNDEAWGPTGAVKYELSQATFSYDQFPEVMGMLWKRIAENKRSPRRIYKSLLLLHHLLLNGSERVIRATNDRIYELRGLTEYHVVYEPGFSLNSIIPPEVTKDGELNVRVKAKELVDLLQDEDRLKEDRKKAKKNRDKYVGIGSDRWMTSGTTSTWGSSMGSGEFDETGEDLGRPKSPPLSSPSPKRENSNRKPAFQISSSTSKNNTDEDDFNPREGEAFGDFKAASTKPTQSTVGGGSDDIFPTDFQTAFSAGTEPAQDSITLSSVPAASSSAELFSMSNSLFPGNGIPNASAPASMGGASSSNNQVDLLGELSFDSPGLSSMGSLSNNSAFSPTLASQPISQQILSQPVPQSLQGLNMGPSPSPQLFPQSNSTLFDSILEPAIKSNVQSNNINNNSANAENKQAASLKGTTWGDLNFSLDDLTINPSRNQAAANKPSINQLKSIQRK